MFFRLEGRKNIRKKFEQAVPPKFDRAEIRPRLFSCPIQLATLRRVLRWRSHGFLALGYSNSSHASAVCLPRWFHRCVVVRYGIVSRFSCDV